MPGPYLERGTQETTHLAGAVAYGANPQAWQGQIATPSSSHLPVCTGSSTGSHRQEGLMIQSSQLRL